MKRKLSITGKRVSMILLGASMMCLLSSCAVNDKSENYENVSDETETVDLNANAFSFSAFVSMATSSGDCSNAEIKFARSEFPSSGGVTSFNGLTEFLA